MTDKQAFAQRVGRGLRDRRAALGLKQEDVARALGVSGSAVSQWEMGRIDISAYSLYQLRKLFQRQASQSVGE